MKSRIVLSALSACVALSACGTSEDFMRPWPQVAIAREAALTRVFEMLRPQPSALEAFLRALPKGADLHTHVSGAVSTESLIRWGGEDGACVSTTDFFSSSPPCGPGTVALSTVTPGSPLYGRVLGAWSMEGFIGDVVARHHHFFSSFDKFNAASSNRLVDTMDEIIRRAASQGELHIELLTSLSGGAAGRLADATLPKGVPWSETAILAARETLARDPAFQAALKITTANLDAYESQLRARWRCGSHEADPACDMTVRYLLQGARTQSREYALGQFIYAFEVVQREPRVVGINLVQPEENASSLSNYEDEMMALGVLREYNAKTPGRRPVHISLHAGELIPSVLPSTPEGQRHLKFHIRRAVQVAGAERIGHAVDILSEDEGEGADPQSLLSEMRRRNVLVELCLTSNQQLLGAEGSTHPSASYLEAGVPYALSTDDEGILRSDLSREYVRATRVQGFSYTELKASARSSIEHSFLDGRGLWLDGARDGFVVVPECADSDPASPSTLSPRCASFLLHNARASQAWKLEKKLAAFERAQLAQSH